MSFCDAFENTVLNAMLGAGASLLPGTIYIGLSTTAPADDGTNFTEPSGGAYARQAVINDGTSFGAAVAGQKQNLNAIVYPTATAGWGTVSYYGIFSAISGGVPLMTGPLDVARPIANGDQFRFQAGKLTVALD